MEAVWIKVFVLTLAECVAPAGKSVCQEQQFELHLLNREDCEYALEQMIAMKSDADNVIVNRQKSGCAPSALQIDSFLSLDALNEANSGTSGWQELSEIAARRSTVNQDHSDRLVGLKSCEQTDGVAPCKIGDIIVEAEAGDNVELWKQD